MTKQLHIDIETYSSIDLKSSGIYKYTESLDFEILLVAYAFDKNPVKIIDLVSGEKLPDEFLQGLLDPTVEKHAHNAAFERQSFKQYGWDIPINQWYCSMVKSAYCGLPLGLDFVSKVLDLGDKGKLSTGKQLIRYFCLPCKPTKANGFRERNFPWHDPEKWNLFKIYGINDVEAEREIERLLENYNMPEFERINYIIDQEINDAGILIDTKMAQNAVTIDNRFGEGISARVKEITKLDNPNSPKQLKAWLSNALGKSVTTLAKESVLKLLNSDEEAVEGFEIESIPVGLDPEVKEVLEGRIKMAKSSTKKYVAMLSCVCADNRAHGLFQFYGANRTGRWAGRLIQLQNLPQNHMKGLGEARRVIASGDYDLACMLYDNIPNVLSELIRTAFVSPDLFGVADFSAIEARVLSWVAGEKWRMDVFNTHGKIYEASAAMMFNVPIESVTKGSDLRQRGKTAELALGYQGSEGAMVKMDREKKLTSLEMKTIVKKWRKVNPKIVQLWQDVESCAIKAFKTRKSQYLKYLGFHYDGKNFMIQLPSGRRLFYNNPMMGVNRFGNESLTFMGMDQVIKQWVRIETYGGKLVENIIQAISRDLLAYSMQRLKMEGFKMVMHVHDEVICEIKNEKELEKMNTIMSEPVPWAPGLPLIADGYVTPFYKKD